jgi:hypothetical protein
MEILNLNLTEDWMDSVHDMINNLGAISDSFKKHSLKPEIYNTQFGAYLEQISIQMMKDKRKLEYQSSMYSDI